MSAVLSPLARHGAWRQAMPAVLAALAAVLLLYRSSFVTMVEIWSRSETFAHAFLVPPIVLWLVWRKRGAVAALVPQPQPWALLPIAVAALAWLLGDVAGVNAVTHLAVTALLVLVVPAVLGWAVTRQLAFPLGFVFFMVPVGDFLMPQLMSWTADFTVFAVSASGVPVYREGLQFVIPSGSWSVVEACSGVRYLIASVMVGTLFAYLNYRSLRRRLLFCAIAVLVPVLANWLRAYMIVMIGHLSDNRLAVGVDHLIYGWVFFGVVIMLMFFIGARWSEAPAPDAPATALPLAMTQQAPAAPSWLAAAAVAALLAAPHLALWRVTDSNQAAAPLQLSLPELGASAAPAEVGPVLQPVFVGAAAQASRSYAAEGGSVTVHVAYFRHQGYGRKLASSANTLVASDDPLWNHVNSGRAELQVGDERLSLRTAELLGGNWRHSSTQPRLDVRQIHWAGGQLTSSGPWATVLNIASRLGGRGDDAATITFYTAGNAAQTTPRLHAFIAAQLPAIRSRLQAIAAQR